MSLSAKRSAYSDMPSVSSQSAICCIAATNRISQACASGSVAHTVYPTRCKIGGRFLAGLDTPTRPSGHHLGGDRIKLSQCINWQWRSDVVGHSRLRWSRPRLVHVRFTSDSDRQPSNRDPALWARSKLPHCDEIDSHSITLSASNCILSETLRPSAFAVFILMTSSYLVAACSGRSAGLSPLRMRST